MLYTRTTEKEPETAISFAYFNRHLQREVSSKSITQTVSLAIVLLPISSVVVGNSELTGHQNVVKVDVFVHRPKFKSHGTDRSQAKEGSGIIEVGWVRNLSRHPFPLSRTDKDTYVVKRISQGGDEARLLERTSYSAFSMSSGFHFPR